MPLINYISLNSDIMENELSYGVNESLFGEHSPINSTVANSKHENNAEISTDSLQLSNSLVCQTKKSGILKHCHGNFNLILKEKIQISWIYRIPTFRKIFLQ